jgi:hypothetical protein
MKTLITAEVAKTSMTGILRWCLPVIFCAALATTANAQEQVIFNFNFDKTGWTPEENGFTLVEPNGHVIGTAPFGGSDGGFIYGTSQSGGSGNAGVVWAYNTSTAEMTTLYTFQGGTDGAYPNGGVIGLYPTSVQNNAYYLLGTTGGGGGSTTCNGGCGTVFAITVSLTSQGQTVTETQLHAFSETDGGVPLSGLTRAGGGAWGTTSEGGPNSSGTLFEVEITSHIDYTTFTYVPIYNFMGSPGDGNGPGTGLGADSAGNLYGMTAGGGENQNTGLDEGAGTLFKFIP